MKIYSFRSKPHNIERSKEFLENDFLAIGWTEVKNLTNVSKDEIKKRLQELKTDDGELKYTGQSLSTNLSLVNTFVNDMKPGDIVLMKTKNKIVHIGKVGPYEWDPEKENQLMAHTRSIQWITSAHLKEFNDSIVKLLGNIRTICPYKKSFEESGLSKFLSDDFEVPITETKKNNESGNQELFAKSLEVLTELMNNAKDESVRLEAAKEILKSLKK